MAKTMPTGFSMVEAPEGMGELSATMVLAIEESARRQSRFDLDDILQGHATAIGYVVGRNYSPALVGTIVEALQNALMDGAKQGQAS